MTMDMGTMERTAARKERTRPLPNTRADYVSALEHLSELSVCKYHDPFTDIAWDAPAHRIDPGDLRLAIADDHALAHTA